MKQPFTALAIEPLGEAGLLVRGPQRIDASLNRAVQELAKSLQASPIDGVADLVPAYASLAVILDPRWLARQTEDGIAALTQAIRQRADQIEARVGPPPRHITIPVCYGGDCGPDLQAVATQTGLAAEEVINRHAAAEYRVAFIGFQPGFPYLLGLDEKLVLPRLAAPRVRVPAGSVAIGGAQTGIYPRESPGGWQLIGRTQAVLFDESAREPTLLVPGDRVSLCRVSMDALATAKVTGARR